MMNYDPELPASHFTRFLFELTSKTFFLFCYQALALHQSHIPNIYMCVCVCDCVRLYLFFCHLFYDAENFLHQTESIFIPWTPSRDDYGWLSLETIA